MDGSSSEAGVQAGLVFQVATHGHEIDASRVLEVIRVPDMTRVPHGPDALKGIINLRGRPIPVLSMSRLLNGADDTIGGDAKIIVYDHEGPIGLLVDNVLRLSADVTATPLQGLGALIDAVFRGERRAPTKQESSLDRNQGGQARVRLKGFLSFRVAGQLLGLPLDCIREVSTFDGHLTILPNTAEALLGVIPLRDSVLPLVALGPLMGLDGARPVNANSRIVVVEHEDNLVGLVVDEMDVIQRLPEQAMDPVPAVLQRGGGNAQIDAIGRLAEGRMLISILSPRRLFNHHAVAQALRQNEGAKPMESKPEAEGAVEHFLIFQLGDENYGVPIVSVDEVIRVPDEITRVPGAPSFVIGVINLHGKVVPLINQRTRFQTPVAVQTAKARAIVFTIGALQAGFVVDGVSNVKSVPVDALSAAPKFSSDKTNVFDRIAATEVDGRMILLIDPQELLTRAEHDVVIAVTSDKQMVADP